MPCVATQIAIRFRIDFTHHSSVGSSKIELLESIQSCGSLSQAARDLGMSYRYAWRLLDSINAAFREPVTLATVGGKGGGGVVLTIFGERLVDSYRALEREVVHLAARRLRPITAAINQAATKSAPCRNDRSRSVL